MQRYSRPLAVLLLCGAGVSFGQERQIEWFPPEAMSHLVVRAHASVSDEVNDTCTFAVLNRPESCPWCDQFARCSKQLPSATVPFRAEEPTIATVDRPPWIHATTRSTATSTAQFERTSFRLGNVISTSFVTQGTSVPANRGLADASGDVRFRVPDGPPMDYVLSGSIDLEGVNSHLQLLGVPNTGASLSRGFSYNSNSMPQGRTQISTGGTITPGLYRLFWFLVADQISAGSARLGAIDVELRFVESCNPVAGAHLPRDFDEDLTGLYGPYATADAAAIAAQPVLSAVTFAPFSWSAGHELGLWIVQDITDDQFYLTPPVQSEGLFDFLLIRGTVTGDDYRRSSEQAFRSCPGHPEFFRGIATAHTHPVSLDDPRAERANVFSEADYRQAIETPLERIYLFPPDRCIRSFVTSPGEAFSCEGDGCASYENRMTIVHCG